MNKKLTQEMYTYFQKIDRMYPSGIVSGLKNKNKNLYEEGKIHAKELNLTLKTFFEKNGYTFVRENLTELYKKDKLVLLELYPDKKVENLAEKDRKIYFRILNHSKLECSSMEEYIEEKLNLKYNMYNTEEIIKEIKVELKKMYPKKKVEKLSVKNNPLYSKIYKLANRQNKDMNDIIIELGFKI